MKYLKKILFSITYILVSLLILTFIISIFNYFNIINDKIIIIFQILIPIISFFIGGYYIGKKSTKIGYLEGIKIGLISIILLILICIILFDYKFQIKYILFYLINIISSTLGSIIGINRKKI